MSGDRSHICSEAVRVPRPSLGRYSEHLGPSATMSRRRKSGLTALILFKRATFTILSKETYTAAYDVRSESVGLRRNLIWSDVFLAPI